MVPPEYLSHQFSQIAGELAESLSFNKSVGQIYGLLYLSDGPLSLEDIAKTLSMSKGNASINLRILKSWGAVRSIWRSGSRRDFYEANRNIKELGIRRLQDGVGRRLDMAEEALDRILEDDRFKQEDQNGAEVKKRMKELRRLLATGRKALKILPKIAGLLGK